MSFDIDNVLSDILSAMKGAVGNNWEGVKSTADQFFQRDKERLQLIANLRITGELNDEKFQSRLDDEKLVLEAELNALAVVSKAIAQNAAIDVVEKAVVVAIKGVV